MKRFTLLFLGVFALLLLFALPGFAFNDHDVSGNDMTIMTSNELAGVDLNSGAAALSPLNSKGDEDDDDKSGDHDDDRDDDKDDDKDDDRDDDRHDDKDDDRDDDKDHRTPEPTKTPDHDDDDDDHRTPEPTKTPDHDDDDDDHRTPEPTKTPDHDDDDDDHRTPEPTKTPDHDDDDDDHRTPEPTHTPGHDDDDDDRTPEPTHTPGYDDGTPDPTHTPQVGRPFEFRGRIEAMNGNVWTIDGRTVMVTSRTRLEAEYGPLTVGAWVEVKAVPLGNGTMVAQEVERKPDNDASRSTNDNSSSNTDDNSAAMAQAPVAPDQEVQQIFVAIIQWLMETFQIDFSQLLQLFAQADSQ
jgi:hypothetical protein